MVDKLKYYLFVFCFIMYFLSLGFILLKKLQVSESFLTYKTLNNREKYLTLDTLTIFHKHETDPSSTIYGTIIFKGTLSQKKTNAELYIQKDQDYKYIYDSKDDFRIAVYVDELTNNLYLKDVEQEEEYFSHHKTRVYIDFIFYSFFCLGTLSILFIILRYFYYANKKQN